MGPWPFGVSNWSNAMLYHNTKTTRNTIQLILQAYSYYIVYNLCIKMFFEKKSITMGIKAFGIYIFLNIESYALIFKKWFAQ